MRALVVSEYGPWDSHSLRDDWPEPVPGPSEVLIDTRAMSVNFPDVLMVEGLYQHKPPAPVVAGFDAAGIVLATGDGVTRCSVGDRVFAYVPDGAFAERLAARQTSVWKMPDDMAFTEAAAFGLAYLTAHVSMIENAKARPGETVLVTGASGGVGIAMIQYGAALGMRMIGGVTSDEKAELVMRQGAVATVDLASNNLRDSVREQVYAETHGKGVDLVMDMVGGDVFDSCLRAIVRGGRIAIVGFAGGRIPTIKANYLLLKKITVIGSPLGTRRADSSEVHEQAMNSVLGAWRDGKVAPYISEILPLSEWQTAFSRFKSREVVGKIVLEP